jgi:hypothetical protein
MSSGIGVCCAKAALTHMVAIAAKADFMSAIPVTPLRLLYIRPNMADPGDNLHRFSNLISP